MMEGGATHHGVPGSEAGSPAPRPIAGLLAVPALLVVLALAGMALSTEDRSDFERRTEQISDDGRSSPGRQGDGLSFPDSGTDDRPTDGGEQRGESGDRIVIQTENGDVAVEFDENGQPIQIVEGGPEGSVPDQRVFRPDADGDVIGVRVTEDGRLEPVPSGGARADDLLTRPTADGIEIMRPDGSRVRVTPADDGTVEGTEIDPDGTRRPLTPDGDGILVQPGSELPPGIRIDPLTEPMVIETEAGSIRFDLEPNGDVTAGVAEPSPQGIPLDPENSEQVGVRVNEDGSLDVVPIDEIGPDDTTLIPVDGGVDLVRPDGSRVEFRPGGENDGITATEVSPDGERNELSPNPDGSVTLSDGTTVGPIDFAEDGGIIEQLIEGTSELPWPWVAGGIALLALVSIGTAVYLHRNRPDNALDMSRFATHGVPPDRFEEFLADLAADPDPDRAIRLAFHAAERGLSGLPPRRSEETPFEWHARVAQLRPELADALAPICDLFATVRFAPGGATPADVGAMIDALRSLDLTSSAPSSGRDQVGAQPVGVRNG